MILKLHSKMLFWERMKTFEPVCSPFRCYFFQLNVSVDPKLSNDPSGCAAVAVLLSHDNKIYVVRPCPFICIPRDD